MAQLCFNASAFGNVSHRQFVKSSVRSPRLCRSIAYRLRSVAGEHSAPSEDDGHPKAGVPRAAKALLASMSTRNKELGQQLKRYGISGVLSYGLFNTVYYLGAFLFVWFYVSPSPGRLGYAAAAQRLIKLFAMVWAGSQVTKLFRAAGALALAPLVDRGLTAFTSRFQFESREKAFLLIVGCCFAMALVIFALLTTLWA